MDQSQETISIILGAGNKREESSHDCELKIEANQVCKSRKSDVGKTSKKIGTANSLTAWKWQTNRTKEQRNKNILDRDQFGIVSVAASIGNLQYIVSCLCWTRCFSHYSLPCICVRLMEMHHATWMNRGKIHQVSIYNVMNWNSWLCVFPTNQYNYRTVPRSHYIVLVDWAIFRRWILASNVRENE